jgi:cytoskeletal protein CcmA (bactofilin family)
MELSEQNGGSRFGGRGAGAQSDRSNPTEKRPAEEDVMSVIGTGIVVTGNIEAEVDLHIEGSVIGDVRCATLILGERGSVTGSVFEGGIEATDLAIEACANVKGDVTYSRLRVANGGVISGTMTHKPVEETSKLTLVEAVVEAPPKVHFIE